MRTLIFILCILFAGLQYKLWLGDGSISAWRAVKTKADTQIEENEKLISRNAKLEADIIDLKKSTDALEEQARQTLGMIKEGEVYYQFSDPRK